MIGIPLGLLYANAVESLFHRYVLHGIGKNPDSFWAFHWSEHHRVARRAGFVDEGYRRPLVAWHAQTKERLAIALGVAIHLPLAPVAPFFFGMGPDQDANWGIGLTWYDLLVGTRVRYAGTEREAADRARAATRMARAAM
jgi:hypothetical protein